MSHCCKGNSELPLILHTQCPLLMTLNHKSLPGLNEDSRPLKMIQHITVQIKSPNML